MALHPMWRRWPDWEFGSLTDGRRYARRGRTVVIGSSLGYLDRVLWAEPSKELAGAWEGTE
ncbi:hypothetical protein HNR23_000777 [Nocardiopsis mwathae]|uniref:Uncharacterized protein n=1 Tax=Nocardiopsis mwathae TaxID=1472723 RepID=A0A7X0D3Y5_9ACTN|nr:hypothetical protein [Nocardiopsis mwathae]MBB6170717.1 hypothetical protein [Nocardiopsis mwathae]